MLKKYFLTGCMNILHNHDLGQLSRITTVWNNFTFEFGTVVIQTAELFWYYLERLVSLIASTQQIKISGY